MPSCDHLLPAARATLAGFHQLPRAVRDELAQESVLRVLGVEHVDAPVALTRRIARNLAIDWLRRRREERLPEVALGSDRWQARTDARLDAQRVLRVLDAAPSAYRDVVRRCFLEEEDVETLIDEELLPGEVRHRVQDRIYKRRSRGLAWARRHLKAG